MTEGERIANSAAWWLEPHPREPSLDVLAELIDAALAAATSQRDRLRVLLEEARIYLKRPTPLTARIDAALSEEKTDG